MTEVLVEVDAGVATITMNRPEQLNAWNPVMFEAFPAAMRRCNDDDSIRAIVVTGAGRGFCAGFDPSSGVPATARSLDPLPWEMRKPVIAAMSGWLRDTPDTREGLAAFVEKRRPRWSMPPSTPLPGRDEP